MSKEITNIIKRTPLPSAIRGRRDFSLREEHFLQKSIRDFWQTPLPHGLLFASARKKMNFKLIGKKMARENEPFFEPSFYERNLYKRGQSAPLIVEERRQEQLLERYYEKGVEFGFFKEMPEEWIKSKREEERRKKLKGQEESRIDRRDFRNEFGPFDNIDLLDEKPNQQ
jgi:hypothetical protein